jgi:hypothetical protein
VQTGTEKAGPDAAGEFEEATVNALILANFPVAILVVLAIVGIPLWMTFKRPESAPDYAGARAYLRARASRDRTAAPAARTARTGLAPVPQHAAAWTSTAHGNAASIAQPTRAAA